MKIKYKNYIVKIVFVGDSITPIYRFRVYIPRKYWFNKCVWEEIVHNKDISNVKSTIVSVVTNYELDYYKWR